MALLDFLQLSCVVQFYVLNHWIQAILGRDVTLGSLKTKGPDKMGAIWLWFLLSSYGFYLELTGSVKPKQKMQ